MILLIGCAALRPRGLGMFPSGISGAQCGTGSLCLPELPPEVVQVVPGTVQLQRGGEVVRFRVNPALVFGNQRLDGCDAHADQEHCKAATRETLRQLLGKKSQTLQMYKEWKQKMEEML